MQTTFLYNSSFWTNKETWNVDVGLDGLAQNETKLASYHNTPFTKLCLGMTRNSVTNWILINYSGSSLYSLIADDKYNNTNIGRAEWVSLINGASLQHHCSMEGFNVKILEHNVKLRLGIAGNNEENCDSCDSVIGFGFEINSWKWSCGNIQHSTTQPLKTFGYIFVQ